MDSSARRDSLIRLLRRRGYSTVVELASELEVSRRTVLRDLQTLRGRGFAIEAQGGPGGGVRLDPSSILLSSQLATDEVVALIVSVAVLRATPTIPFASGAERALAKIEAALPAKRVRELRRFMSRLLIGDPARPGMTSGPIDPLLLPAFEHAFTANRELRFGYADQAGRRTRRRVEPHGLLVRAPIWYVIAWDVDRDAARLFRADRVRRPISATETTFRPRPVDDVTSICPDARPR